MADANDNPAPAARDVDALARHFMEAEGEQIVRDMAGHLGDQLFETMKRNGMMMRSVAGAVGILTLAAAQTFEQGHDFLTRSLADASDGEPVLTAGPDEAAAIAKVFVGELSDVLKDALMAVLPTEQPLASAPKDGTMVWLLVDYEAAPLPRVDHGAIEADHPLADATRAWTIGFNNLDHDGEDEWKFAGWCWSHDHFTEGRGTPVAWKPLGFALDPAEAVRA